MPITILAMGTNLLMYEYFNDNKSLLPEIEYIRTLN